VRASQQFGERAWGAPRRLNALDTFMWRCEQDPRLRSGLVMLYLLDRPPDPQRFAAGHEWATRMVPRLRERPVAPLLAPTVPVWTPDPRFDVAAHLRRAALPRPAGRRELLDLAEDLAAAPFAPDRPPWQSVLVEDLCWEPEGYRAAWLLKFHHALGDGSLVASWLATLLGRGREPRADKPRPPAPALLLDSVAQRLVGPLAGEAGPAVRRIAGAALRTARTPLRTTAEVGRATRTLIETTTRPVGRPSPLLRARGTTRRFEAVTADLNGLRSAARAVGVSTNAALCAGLLAGFRLYHDAHRVTASTLPFAMTVPGPGPVSARDTGRPGGNRFSGVKLAGPLDERDPVALCRTVGRLLSSAAAPFSPAALDAVLACVNQLPTTLLTGLAASLGHSYDLQVSHVVAPARGAYVSGARIELGYCFGPVPGCAVMALMVSQRGRGALALTVDTAAVPDPPVLTACIESGFADVIGGCAAASQRGSSL
jgi:WS/DGAT/MGAT family acyltransferase